MRGKMWTQRDRFGNDIYLTYERWAHIIDPENHAEVAPYNDYLRETIRLGRRKPDPLIPNAYKCYREFTDLPYGMNHLVAVVVFRTVIGSNGPDHVERFIVTAYLQLF
jgi:hypothetical protein